MADKKGQRFTIDSDKDGAEVPTLTKLLYKKNVVKSQSSPGSGRQGRGLDAGSSLEQDRSRIMTLEPTLTGQSLHSTQASGITPSPARSSQADFVVSQLASNRAQPLNMGKASGGSTDRRIMQAAQPFVMPETIRPSSPKKYPTTTPAGAGLRVLFDQAKIDSGILFEDTGEAYVSRAIVASANERAVLWSGMEIQKATFSDLLSRLEKFGFAEFSTLGTAGSGNFDRTTFRAAFQAKNSEWVTLIRVKNPSGKDAIVAVLSPASIQMHLPAFHSAGMSGGVRAVA
jgi:hypothetical protein